MKNGFRIVVKSEEKTRNDEKDVADALMDKDPLDPRYILHCSYLMSSGTVSSDP